MANDTHSGAGGFAVVLGNPPWERVKLQEREFFATRDVGIAEAKNAAARKRLIKQLSDANPSLSTEWLAAQRRAGGESHLLRNSGAFPLGGVGDVNTYAVFADLFRRTLGRSGRAGIILPNGLVTGFTYREFLDYMLETRTLVSFFGFENEDKIFPQVHNETKFGLLTLSGEDCPVDRIDFTAHIRQPTSIHDPQRRYSLTVEQIEKINPNTRAIPMFRLAGDAEVSAAIHSAAPVLVHKAEGHLDESPWGVRFQRMFDMANDSALFLDHADIAPRILRREEAKAVLDDNTEVFPLYEGKMFWHFNHRYGTYEGQTERQANKGVLPRVPDDRLAEPGYQVQPRYWVESAEVQRAMGDETDRYWLLSWRDVGISERTFIVSPVPLAAVGHNAPVIYANADSSAVVALTALLSSLLVDYDARQKSYRMTYFVVEQLAVLSPSQLRQHVPWMGTSAESWLGRRTLELCYTSHELVGLAQDAGYVGAPFVWNAERRELIQAEIDAAVLHLYGLARTQAEWIIDSFDVLSKYERRAHGEFRTKRLVLDVFDRIAKSIQSRTVFESAINPPPGDAAATHTPESTRRGVTRAAPGIIVHQGEIELDRVLLAFREVRDGMSADYVVVEPVMNQRFQAAARNAGLRADPALLNTALLNLRKAGELKDEERSKQYRLRKQYRPYLFASEWSVRHLQRTLLEEVNRMPALDELLCNPEWAGRFDEIAARIKPGFDPIDYRWAALSIRKRGRSQPEPDTLELPMHRQLTLEEWRNPGVPAGAGLYLIYADQRPVYVNWSADLAGQIARHREVAGDEMAPPWLLTGVGRADRITLASYPLREPEQLQEMRIAHIARLEPWLNLLDLGDVA